MSNRRNRIGQMVFFRMRLVRRKAKEDQPALQLLLRTRIKVGKRRVEVGVQLSETRRSANVLPGNSNP
jgi:hypothetical protein